MRRGINLSKFGEICDSSFFSFTSLIIEPANDYRLPKKISFYPSILTGCIVVTQFSKVLLFPIKKEVSCTLSWSRKLSVRFKAWGRGVLWEFLGGDVSLGPWNP